MSHPEQLAFVASVRERFPWFFDRARVVEVGSRDVNGSVRQFFTGCDYVGLDAVAGPGVDVVCLAHEYHPDDYFDTVICCEVLEHDPFWRESVAVMAGWLRPGGLFVATWAGPAREEHGTARTGEPYGPHPDYYANISPAEFRAVANPLFDWLELTEARDGQDVYAVGRR